MNERITRAGNYLWIKTNKDEIVKVDNLLVSSVFMPISFNCVLIAYHAFLLEQTKPALQKLVSYLYIYFCRNLSQVDELPDSVGSIDLIDDCIIELKKLIIDFYTNHKDNIDSEKLRFDRILNEETLSGYSFNDDINVQLEKTIQEKVLENSKAYDELDKSIIDNLQEKVRAYSFTGNLNALESEFKEINSVLPNKAVDVDQLLEQEKCKRLIVSINAIYILIKTTERMIDIKLASPDKSDELRVVVRTLSNFEDFLVKKTYVAPAVFYDDNRTLNMNNYRLQKGIDSSEIEKRNEKAFHEYLFESANNAINDLHKEANNLTFEKAGEIKAKLREKINNAPDSDLKEFVINLVDKESLFICDCLIKENKEKEEFLEFKRSICVYLGDTSSKLPEKTVNAIATAELLFSKYAKPEYSSMCFDYSCVSALYYQAVESMYNELIWKSYSYFLNELAYKRQSFRMLYSNNEDLPPTLQGYLPKGDYSENGRIKDSLTYGSFVYLFYNVTSQAKHELRGFRVHIDRVFGYSAETKGTSGYAIYQKIIDEFYQQLKDAKDRRNNASHGEKPINLEECKTDKRIVLSDVESMRNDYLGLIRLFLSLYRSES